MMQLHSTEIPAQEIIDEIKQIFPKIDLLRDEAYRKAHPYDYHPREYYPTLMSKEMDELLKKYGVPGRSKARGRHQKRRLLHWFLEKKIQKLASEAANVILAAIATDEDVNALKRSAMELSGIQTFPDFEDAVKEVKKALPDSMNWEEKLPYQKALYPEAQAIAAQLSAATGLDFALLQYGSLEYYQFDYFIAGNKLLSYLGAVSVTFNKIDFDRFHSDLKDGVISMDKCEKCKDFLAPYKLKDNEYRVTASFSTFSRRKIRDCLVECGQLVDVLGNTPYQYTCGLNQHDFHACSRTRITGEIAVGNQEEWFNYHDKLRKCREAGMIDESINAGYQLPASPSQ